MNEECIDYYRLKSVRRKRRLQKLDFEKHLLALNKEERQLNRQVNNLGYEPLVPPIQKGWKRIFVLTEEVAKSTRAQLFEELLQLVNTVQYSDTRAFKRRVRRNGKKIYVNAEQKMKVIYEHEWYRLNLTPQQSFFFTQYYRYDHLPKCLYKVYEFNEPWRFKLKVVPNLITKVRIRDFALEKRLKEIDNYLLRNNYRIVISSLRGHSSHFRHPLEKHKYKNFLSNKPLYKMLDEYYEEL